MWLRLHFINDVNYFNPLHFQVIRNQSPMAPPPDRFGAHNGRALRTRKFHESIDPLTKLITFHVVRVTAESFVSPGYIGRALTRPAPATQFSAVHIADVKIGERDNQSGLSKLRITARTRKAAHVNQHLNS